MASFTKNSGQTIAGQAERVGMVTMTKKVITFFKEKIPSVTAPGDTNVSDATARQSQTQSTA